MTAEARLTCHVLDLTSGLPAAGVAITVSRLDGDAPGPVAATTTNADGRTDAPLLQGDALVPGRYEVAFAIGDHFAVAEPAERYLDVVPIHVGVAPGATHLHVALLVTPFAYSTYRGS